MNDPQLFGIGSDNRHEFSWRLVERLERGAGWWYNRASGTVNDHRHYMMLPVTN